MNDVVIIKANKILSYREREDMCEELSEQGKKYGFVVLPNDCQIVAVLEKKDSNSYKMVVRS